MSKKAPAPEESVSVNVVPLVDIMFLLLLFLMVGGDMSHRESTEVMLPQADKATPQEDKEGKRSYNVNVHPKNESLDHNSPAFRANDNWQFAIQGIEYPDYWALLEKLTEIAEMKREEKPIEGTRPPKYLSEVFVVIRADKAAPYGMIQQAMQACAEVGIYKIEVGAAKPADAK